MGIDLCGLVYSKGFAEYYCSSQLTMLLNIHGGSELAVELPAFEVQAFEVPAFEVLHVDELGLHF